MSWLAWIIAAAVLCPAWWRVAKEADRLRRRGGDSVGRLPYVLHTAALATVAVIAFLAFASFYTHFATNREVTAELTDQ
jgi:hypothetical protein